ncbi:MULTISPECIES: septum formation initiator family protein [unclassified Micromonospora]|uniref:FtsB family cell division protein n=1 Tax=unclassified Micromonospora TaxID=2617518 RepID=UPI001045D30F|nr:MULTISPECIES: septum formation initiator family protein [unclassified Micromonospora]TDB77596.1 septum formation initiator family protein [Micromonospora sp. KC721]TDC38112.1 septum formation initiator family protein [Micromonospora sp. KC213]
MQQRRTPGGPRPARRPTGRPGGARARTSVRDGGIRAEPRSAARVRGTDGVRSASRPAAARRTATGGTIRRLTAPHPRRFTGRATVLFAVLIALALAYTYPVRVYLDQQVDIERMEAAQVAQRQDIARLSAEAAKWQDEEYIKIKARERFFMVPPGETPVIVLYDPEGAARDAAAGRPKAPPKDPDPWYDTLWSSVRAANAERPDQ